MSTEIPIACSLSSADLAVRVAEISDLGRSALVDVRRDGTRAVLRFRTGDETAQRLEAVVEGEARCCPFLDMTVRARADGLTLTIDAPDEAAPVVDGLVEAFAGR